MTKRMDVGAFLTRRSAHKLAGTVATSLLCVGLLGTNGLAYAHAIGPVTPAMIADPSGIEVAYVAPDGDDVLLAKDAKGSDDAIDQERVGKDGADNPVERERVGKDGADNPVERERVGKDGKGSDDSRVGKDGKGSDDSRQG